MCLKFKLAEIVGAAYLNTGLVIGEKCLRESAGGASCEQEGMPVNGVVRAGAECECEVLFQLFAVCGRKPGFKRHGICGVGLESVFRNDVQSPVIDVEIIACCRRDLKMILYAAEQRFCGEFDLYTAVLRKAGVSVVGVCGRDLELLRGAESPAVTYIAVVVLGGEAHHTALVEGVVGFEQV